MRYLSSAEAARELGITLPTLYSYVSRGVLTSYPQAGRKSRLYDADQIAKFKVRGEILNNEQVTETIMHYGHPVLETQVSGIVNGQLMFRGHEVGTLARVSTAEDIADLLWAGYGRSASLEWIAGELPKLESGSIEIDRALVDCQSWLISRIEVDQSAFDNSRERILEVAPLIWRGAASFFFGSALTGRALHEDIARVADLQDHAEIIRTCLVVLADHELTASTFAARVIASTGAPIYQAISAGLAALNGARHLGEIERAYRQFKQLLDEANPELAIRQAQRRGDQIYGFEHTIYPTGDPRAEIILQLASTLDANEDFLVIKESIGGKTLNFEGAIAMLAISLGKDWRFATALVISSRLIGLIAHCIEQYDQQKMIRPRARYLSGRAG
ncbi:citrate synthase [Leisingera sp.]|uniref:citrate synthase n=1 Tax=Leisingera sp. TaxID=1879318 RepID=UPI002B26501D|nr:citrate synthase [Leisingera sp.]